MFSKFKKYIIGFFVLLGGILVAFLSGKSSGRKDEKFKNIKTESKKIKKRIKDNVAGQKVIEKSIKLISSTQSKYAQKMLLEIHQLVLAQLTADNFNEQYPKVKLHKVEFNPKVKNTVVDLLNGADLIKYVSNI